MLERKDEHDRELNGDSTIAIRNTRVADSSALYGLDMAVRLPSIGSQYLCPNPALFLHLSASKRGHLPLASIRRWVASLQLVSLAAAQL